MYKPKKIDECTHMYCVPLLCNDGYCQICPPGREAKNPNVAGACSNPNNDLIDCGLQESLRQELIKQLKDGKYLERLCKRLENSEYKMRKDEMFRRMQVEKEEKEFQDCLCYGVKSKERRQGQICTEHKLAQAMREMKDEEQRESAFLKQLKACSPEIRELERQIRRSYYAKTLFAQRMEGDALKLEEKVRERDNYEMMLEQLAKYDQNERDKIQASFLKKKAYLSELKSQMENKESKLNVQEEEKRKDKKMVDEIVALIRQEEIDDLQEKVDKVNSYRNEIKHFLMAREVVREHEKQKEINEEERRLKYLEDKEAAVADFKRKKDEENALKSAIVAKAIERMMKEQFKREEIEELRQELMEEELKAEIRQREIDDLTKKYQQMMELREAAANAMKMREEKLKMEKEEEEEYRKQLMEKFAEDERLGQLTYQKRRLREREHRLQVEKMIAERRALRAQEKERDQHVLDCMRMEDERRQKIIDAERVRLLKYHGPNILGFIPRNVIKSRKELEALGEPFLEYYTNPPLYPDPSTIDTEPCEEEIFKNMPVPRNIKT